MHQATSLFVTVENIPDDGDVAKPWDFYNIATEHNKLVDADPDLPASWQYDSIMERIVNVSSPGYGPSGPETTSYNGMAGDQKKMHALVPQTTCIRGNVLCCGGTPPTATLFGVASASCDCVPYIESGRRCRALNVDGSVCFYVETQQAEIEPNVVLLAYDRLANGWNGSPGPYGRGRTARSTPSLLCGLNLKGSLGRRF